MAYAALLSLSQTLDQILVLEQYPLLFKKEILITLHRNVTTLLTFLEDYSHKCNGVVNPMESRIIDVAHNAEDIIEYHAVDVRESRFSRSFLSKSWTGNIIKLCASICWPEARRNFASLEKVLLKIDLILEEVIKMKKNYPGEKNEPSGDFYDYPSLSVSDTNTIVFQDDFMVLNERICNNSCSFDVIPIVGMGGIGKTTLARSLYDDSAKAKNFDRYVWVVVSQDYSSREILSKILASIGKPTNEEYYTDSKLEQLIYQELYNRRYLVVIDDLWSKNAWDDLNLLFPKDITGSKVLVTTRLLDVASYVRSSFSPPHEIRLLNEHQSWKLLEERVFGEGNSCPCELVQIGKKVAKNCRGLPLTIVVTAGLLKIKGTKEYWESISENISSSEPTIALHCSKVLSLSYSQLPLYLKPCFLYLTSFLEDEHIKTKRLFRLWVAEGFVKPNESKSLEEVAEGYLNDLVGRSLLMVSEKNRYNNRIKTIIIHDVLRDFGASNAQEERIFHFLDDVRREYRRVTTSKVFINNGASLHLLSRFHKPAIRSVLVPYYSWDGNSIENLSLLRVWNASGTGCVPNPIKLIHTIRYLSISHVEDYRLLETISQFRKIQTLIIGEVGNIEGFNVPLRIWKMLSLRHLILPSNCELEQPSEYETIEETSLQTLRSISNLKLTTKVLEMLISLRDFNVIYAGLEDLKGHVNYYHLSNLVHLQNLEKLRILFSPGSIGRKNYPGFLELDFPKSLKKLSITNIDGSWEDISVVGSLPYLEVFKLKTFNSYGGWDPIEGEFLKLKHLEFESVDLDHWEAESEHFPSLEILVLKNIRGLKEIPNGIGEIDTLEVIKLVNGETSIVDSARQIQAEQWDLGNEDLQVLEFVTQSAIAKTTRR